MLSFLAFQSLLPLLLAVLMKFLSGKFFLINFFSKQDPIMSTLSTLWMSNVSFSLPATTTIAKESSSQLSPIPALPPVQHSPQYSSDNDSVESLHSSSWEETMRQILFQGWKLLEKHEILEGEATDLNCKLYAKCDEICIVRAQLHDFFNTQVEHLHRADDVDLSQPKLQKVFLCFNHLVPTNFNVLSSFLTVWDSMFKPNHLVSFLNAPFHCSYFGWDKSLTIEGMAWQHVATTHMLKEALCPFCARASSPVGRNNLIGYTNPATLHLHFMFIHVIRPRSSTL